MKCNVSINFITIDQIGKHIYIFRNSIRNNTLKEKKILRFDCKLDSEKREMKSKNGNKSIAVEHLCEIEREKRNYKKIIAKM